MKNKPVVQDAYDLLLLYGYRFSIRKNGIYYKK